MKNNNTILLDVDMILLKKMSFIGTMQKIYGVLAIISGGISCLGIITAIFGIPLIISGVKLFQSGSAFSYAAYSNDSKFLRMAILNLASYWFMSLILIISIIVFYIFFIGMMYFIMLAMSYANGIIRG